MDYPVSCTIGLGSNAPDREAQINRAIDFLHGYLSKCSVSSIYESAAINGTDSSYLNAVVHGRSSVNSSTLVRHLKDFEKAMGRNQESKEKGVVPIDLDLVIYDMRILRPKDFERHYFNIGYRELLANGSFQDE